MKHCIEQQEQVSLWVQNLSAETHFMTVECVWSWSRRTKRTNCLLQGDMSLSGRGVLVDVWRGSKSFNWNSPFSCPRAFDLEALFSKPRPQTLQLTLGADLLPGDVKRAWQTGRIAATGPFKRPLKGPMRAFDKWRHKSSVLKPFFWRKTGQALKCTITSTTLFHADPSKLRKCHGSINKPLISVVYLRN